MIARKREVVTIQGPILGIEKEMIIHLEKPEVTTTVLGMPEVTITQNPYVVATPAHTQIEAAGSVLTTIWRLGE